MPLQTLGFMKSGLKTYKLIFIIIILISQTVYANKTDDLLNTNIQVDFRSMHTWRGFAASYSPTIEPSFDISNDNYKTGIWFAQSLDGNYSELDLFFTYTYRSFSLTLYDYYCPPSIQASNEITNYEKTSTNHTIELNLSFNGNKNIPLKILLATMIYGDDLNPETNQNYYSTYVQLAYSTEINKNAINLFLGMNTFNGYYGENVGVVNAGLTASRSLNVYKSFVIPVQASLITNPLSNSLFLSFGFTL